MMLKQAEIVFIMQLIVHGGNGRMDQDYSFGDGPLNSADMQEMEYQFAGSQERS